MRIIVIFALCCLGTFPLWSQNGVIRGNIYDRETGEPIPFCNISLNDGSIVVDSDLEGFFSFAGLEAGTYTIKATYIGYDSTETKVILEDGAVVYERLLLSSTGITLNTVDVSGSREKANTTAQVSSLTIRPEQLQLLPSAGGEADIAQYLTLIPGVVSTGEQGGQLYIRGGSAIQNKILLDGMTIYNPFHSIGLFSVFETETLRSIDVYTGGFGATQGGRISAVVDIKTREGNKTKWSGMAAASPFQSKLLVEGPLKKFEENKGSISVLFTGKYGYLDQTSPSLYSYAVDTSFFTFVQEDTSLNAISDDIGLPYSYGDFFGKISFAGTGGSVLNLIGFSFADQFEVLGLANLEWQNGGGAMNFKLIPENSTTVINGTLSYTDYKTDLVEREAGPRSSGITAYNALLRFTNFTANNQLDYGFEFNGFNTDFDFTNATGSVITQRDFTSEISGFFQMRQQLSKLILEPGIRLQFYASQATLSIEPRLAMKYKLSPKVRAKMAAGIYSQNLISTFNDQDIVNLFVGFLAGPEETIFEPGTSQATNNRIQKAWHVIGGLEVDLTDQLLLNVEGYLKDFTQLIQLNRNKLTGSDPDFVVETGDAYGAEVTLDFNNRNGLTAYLAYSLAFANRFDGTETYPPVFDRRHNLNTLISYAFGDRRAWECSARWNLGSGFPFTQTQGFFQNIPFDDLAQTDILGGNFDLETLLGVDRNSGRLPYYHRLDLSIKRSFFFSRDSRMDITASVTNAYNRANVFYVDRQSSNVVEQLPILPSLRLGYYW